MAGGGIMTNTVRKLVESLTKEQSEAFMKLVETPGGIESLRRALQGKPFLNPEPEPQSFRKE